MGLSRGLKQWNHRWIELQDLESSGSEPGLMTYGPAVPWLNLAASRQRWQCDVGPGWCLLADLAMGACTSTRPATYKNISQDLSPSLLQKHEGYRNIIHRYHEQVKIEVLLSWRHHSLCSASWLFWRSRQCGICGRRLWHRTPPCATPWSRCPDCSDPVRFCQMPTATVGFHWISGSQPQFKMLYQI